MQRSINTRLASYAIALFLAGGAVAAHAQASTPVAPAASFQHVVERVVAQGYVDVREVERKSDKLFEVEARDSQGRRVELYVDARSGEVLREKVKR